MLLFLLLSSEPKRQLARRRRRIRRPNRLLMLTFWTLTLLATRPLASVNGATFPARLPERLVGRIDSSSSSISGSAAGSASSDEGEGEIESSSDDEKEDSTTTAMLLLQLQPKQQRQGAPSSETTKNQSNTVHQNETTTKMSETVEDGNVDAKVVHSSSEPKAARRNEPNNKVVAAVEAVDNQNPAQPVPAHHQLTTEQSSSSSSSDAWHIPTAKDPSSSLRETSLLPSEEDGSHSQQQQQQDLLQSQPLQTLQKLQQMLDETDYLTAATHKKVRFEPSPPYPPSVPPPPPSIQPPPPPPLPSEPSKLWTTQDRAKYKKQQSKLRKAQIRSSSSSPPIHLHSDDDAHEDDTDDGLGYTLPNLPVYYSDAEDGESEDGEADALALHPAPTTTRTTLPPPPIVSTEPSSSTTSSGSGGASRLGSDGASYPPNYFSSIPPNFYDPQGHHRQAYLNPPPPPHYYPPPGSYTMPPVPHPPHPFQPYMMAAAATARPGYPYPSYVPPQTFPYGPWSGPYDYVQPPYSQRPPAANHDNNHPVPNVVGPRDRPMKGGTNGNTENVTTLMINKDIQESPIQVGMERPERYMEVAAPYTLLSPYPADFAPAVYMNEHPQSLAEASSRLSLDSIQKSCLMLVAVSLACYAGVSPRSLPLDEYNLQFYGNLRLVSLAFVAPVLEVLSVFDARENDMNAFANTFFVSFVVGYPLAFLMEIMAATIVRLCVFGVFEPDIFSLTPKVPVPILPWVLRDVNYRPKRITLFAADFATSCVACPIIEEYLKLKVLQWTVKLPRNFAWVTRWSSKNAKKRRVAEAIVRHPGEKDIVNANKFVTQMLAASLGLKLTDVTRRILLYTKPRHGSKAFFAICRGVFPIHELCGTMTALSLAKRDLLGFHTPLWKLLAPAVVIHGMANFRGMKPIFKWNSATPWSEMQLSPLNIPDSSTLPQLLNKGFAKLMWLVLLSRVLGYCIKNYYMINRQAVKRTTTYAGKHAAFSAELATAEVLKKKK